jgi:3-oxoadipate enol-lactonase
MLYNSFGSGSENVLVMHNWFSDNSCYAPILPYLDHAKYTFVFMDLRGYGEAKEVRGKYSLKEASDDALLLVNALKWERFHVLSHSMSSMIAQKIALDHPTRIKSLVGINPIPASGAPRTPELLTFLEEASLSNEESAIECIHALTNRRYSQTVAKKLVSNWRNCSTPEARMAYLHMFSNTDFSNQVKGLKTPMLLLLGEHDLQENETLMDKTFLKWYPNTHIASCKGAGHFLIQESPLYLASSIETFFNKHSV